MVASKYRTLSLYPILAVGFSMVGFILIKTGRDTLFFSSDGLTKLPMAYIWIAIAAIPAALLHLKALERWGARRTRTALFVITAVLFSLIVPFAEAENPILMTAMFVLVPTVFAAVFAGAWLLAGDLLEGADQDTLRTVYARIGAGSMLGGITGGLLAKLISRFVPPQYLIAAGILFLLVAAWVVAKAHRENPTEKYEHQRIQEIAAGEASATPSADGPSGAGAYLLKEKYIRLLLGGWLPWSRCSSTSSFMP